jgi:hypothetical protein
MKHNHFLILLCWLFPLVGISQNQVSTFDDIYFKANDAKNIEKTQIVKQTPNQQSINYKKGAKEIVFIEKKIIKPAIVHDTVYVVGQASDMKQNFESEKRNFKDKNGDSQLVIHDTIYVTEQLNDSIDYNSDQGHYLNGFNGNQTDLEYAERIRRFHNPRYAIFIGDPRYNDIYFLNNNDWNVYVDDSYAYVTPTWTNPYWWNYNLNPYGYGNWGWGFGNSWYSPYSYYSGWYNPWGYNGFYGGFGGYYGDYFGYDGYYGYGYPYYGYGYGNWMGYNNRNENYNEANRRSQTNYNGHNRLGGLRIEASGSMIGGSYNTGTSGNQFTIVSGDRTISQAGNSSVPRSMISPSRTVSNQTNGIGLVRNTGTRGIYNQNNTNGNSVTRTNNYNINTQPRTYTTTSTNLPTGNYISRQSSSTNSTYRGNYSASTRSSSSNTIISSPSRGNYSTGNSSGVSRSYSPPASTGSSTYNSGSSGSSYSSGSSSSGSSSGGGRSSGSSGSSGGGRR